LPSNRHGRSQPVSSFRPQSGYDFSDVSAPQREGRLRGRVPCVQVSAGRKDGGPGVRDAEYMTGQLGEPAGTLRARHPSSPLLAGVDATPILRSVQSRCASSWSGAITKRFGGAPGSGRACARTTSRSKAYG